MTAGERAQRLYDEITYGAGVSAATAAIEAAEAARDAEWRKRLDGVLRHLCEGCEDAARANIAAQDKEG